MNFIEIASAVSVGTIAAKLIDVYLLQSMLAKKSLDSWFREKRYTAYCKLSENLLSFGLNSADETNPFLHLSEISPAILLTEDDELTERLYEFINKRDYLFRLQDGEIKDNTDYPNFSSDVKVIYTELSDESKAIVSELRKQIKRKNA